MTDQSLQGAQIEAGRRGRGERMNGRQHACRTLQVRTRFCNSSPKEENEMHETKANMQACCYQRASSSILSLSSKNTYIILIPYKKEKPICTKMQDKL